MEIINEGEGGGNIIGKIVNVSVDESIVENGQVNPDKAHFLVFDPVKAEYKEIGETVANAFREGMKLR